jgi:hypothetical protein
MSVNGWYMLNGRGKNETHAITESMAAPAYGLSTARGLARARDPGIVFEPCDWSGAVARVSDTGNTTNCQWRTEYESTGTAHSRG